ncbi:MAG: nucleotidyltransferase domain-containing protein [Alphaproteobacteria bacterium]|nr:nucleotidyltransferase domain-containing protein [Alphaproteobacteria bacterium]
MRLKCAWGTAAAKADKSDGAPDVDLREHLRKTEQTSLPQAELLQGCFDLLRERGLLEEAYLRGSLGRGHADTHSDIDLFAVIQPEKINQVYDAVNEFLASKGRIIVGCHDRLVENYGGIGFMFIAESDAHDKKTYQFDLYMAMKGVPPAKPTTIKPRMYSADPDYKWIDTYGEKSIELPEVTKSFIQRHTSGDSLGERMELLMQEMLMQEMLINLYVTNKHIKRGQMSRTVVDNHGVVTSAIEFLQLLTGYKSTGYSPVYLGDEVVKFAKENGDKEMADAAGRLEKLFTQPMDALKLVDTLDYAVTVFKQAFPDRYAKQQKMIEFFTETVLVRPAAEHVSRNGLPVARPKAAKLTKLSAALKTQFGCFLGVPPRQDGANLNAPEAKQKKNGIVPKGKPKPQ